MVSAFSSQGCWFKSKLGQTILLSTQHLRFGTRMSGENQGMKREPLSCPRLRSTNLKHFPIYGGLTCIFGIYFVDGANGNGNHKDDSATPVGNTCAGKANLPNL